MAAVTTERLVALAYELAGWEETPPDWMVYEPGTRISHVLFGLEISPADLFMARQLGYHAVVSYEPTGYDGPPGPRLARHVERMVAAGVPREEAIEASAASARAQLADSQSRNYEHAPSVARLLEMPFITVYDPLAEVSRRTIQERIAERLSQLSAPTLADIRDAVQTLRSFTVALTAPQPLAGEWTSPAGRVVVLDHAWGQPSAAEARAYFAHGAGTLCTLDTPPDDVITVAQERRGALITLGRIAGESAGALPFIQRLRDEGIEVTAFAGVLGA